MAAMQEHWPAPDELFHWFGEANVSWDSQAAVVGISSIAVHEAYTEWYRMHREASSKIVELLQNSGDTSTDETDETIDTLKVRIKKLKKELETAQAGARESVGLERQLHSSKEEAIAWKNRFDDLFEMNKRTNRLIDINDALRGNGASQGDGMRNTIVHKI